MIDAEYEELNEADGKLDLADTDSLPWLESDEEDDATGGWDSSQIMMFAAFLVLLGGLAVAGVWFISNKAAGGDLVADGSVIEAPAGPIKERPENPGGKTFAGTGNVAPVVGEGGTRPAVVAIKDAPPAATAPKPSISTVSSTDAVPASAPAALTGVGVQLAAYGTRARVP